MANLRRSLARPLLCWLVTPSFVACGADNLKPESPPAPSDVYWSLTLDHQAITMSPGPLYDTLTITATPRNAAGEALTGLPAPTYVSRDVGKVTVGPDGLVRVLGSGFEPVWVVATLVTGNVRHVDSLRVRSIDVDPIPVLARLSIHPVPPDSAKIALGSDEYAFFTQILPLLVPVRAAGADGLPITDLMVSFRSLDLNVSKIDETTGMLHPVSVGDVPLTASATMFGVIKADTLRYRIGWPLKKLIGLDIREGSLVTDLQRLLIRVGVGAFVGWEVPVGTERFSVDFDSADLPNIKEGAASVGVQVFGAGIFCLGTPLDCTNSGNVVISPPNLGAARTFTAPGTYYYHLPEYGLTGRIDVVDER